MLRDNLRTVINNSGLIIKEIAAKSGVNKRTIDKWVGRNATEPKINDFFKVCQVLGITVEHLLTGHPPDGIPHEIFELARKIESLPTKDREEIMLLVKHKLKYKES